MDPERLQRALENLKAQSLHSVNSIKSFNFSTLYTTILHDKLKSKVKEIINQCFFVFVFFFVFCFFLCVFFYISMVFIAFSMLSSATKIHTSFGITLIYHKNIQMQMSKVLEYLIDNIFVEFGGWIFNQTIGLLMSIDCVPLLADLFLYSYEAEFVQSLLKAGKKHLAQ